MKIDSYIFEETFPGQFKGESSLPDKPEPGKVYFCKEHSISVHLCPCGCETKIFLPFKPTNISGHYWGLSGSTFTPSIYSIYLPCKSHYHIIDGKVVWS